MTADMERFVEAQTWVIMFGPSMSGLRWWHLVLPRQFRHVSLARDINGKCLSVNPLAHVMAIKEYDETLLEFVQRQAPYSTAILQYTVFYGAHYRPACIEPLTCVSMAKRLLGIRKRLVTPKGLYRELLRAGALTLKPWTPHA